MSETIYIKVGRRYKPIYEYDPKVCDSFPVGSHLVVCEPGHMLTRFRVEPDFAPVLAAIASGREAMVTAIQQATLLRPGDGKLSPKQLKAFEDWKKATGEETLILERPSASDIFDAFERAVIEASDRSEKRSERAEPETRAEKQFDPGIK